MHLLCGNDHLTFFPAVELLRNSTRETDGLQQQKFICVKSLFVISGVVEFLSNSKVSVGHLDFKDIDYEQVLNSFSHTTTNDYLNHAFSLKNAYDESIMEYTNYT